MTKDAREKMEEARDQIEESLELLRVSLDDLVDRRRILRGRPIGGAAELRVVEAEIERVKLIIAYAERRLEVPSA